MIPRGLAAEGGFQGVSCWTQKPASLFTQKKHGLQRIQAARRRDRLKSGPEYADADETV